MNMLPTTLLLMSLGVPELAILMAVCVPFLFSVWALISCIRNQKIESSTKALWIVIILLFPLLGAIAYLAAGTGKSKSQPQA